MTPELAAGLAAEFLFAAVVLLLGLVLALVAGRDSIDPATPDVWIVQLTPLSQWEYSPAGHAPIYPGRPALMGQPS